MLHWHLAPVVLGRGELPMADEKMVSVLLPKSLIDRVEAEWDEMHRDPTVAALRPRRTATAAVRIAVHLALEHLDLDRFERERAQKAQPPRPA